MRRICIELINEQDESVLNILQGEKLALAIFDLDRSLRQISKYEENTLIEADKVRQMIRDCLEGVDVERILG